MVKQTISSLNIGFYNTGATDISAIFNGANVYAIYLPTLKLFNLGSVTSADPIADLGSVYVLNNPDVDFTSIVGSIADESTTYESDRFVFFAHRPSTKSNPGIILLTNPGGAPYTITYNESTEENYGTGGTSTDDVVDTPVANGCYFELVESYTNSNVTPYLTTIVWPNYTGSISAAVFGNCLDQNIDAWTTDIGDNTKLGTFIVWAKDNGNETGVPSTLEYSGLNGDYTLLSLPYESGDSDVLDMASYVSSASGQSTSWTPLFNKNSMWDGTIEKVYNNIVANNQFTNQVVDNDSDYFHRGTSIETLEEQLGLDSAFFNLPSNITTLSTSAAHRVDVIYGPKSTEAAAELKRYPRNWISLGYDDLSFDGLVVALAITTAGSNGSQSLISYYLNRGFGSIEFTDAPNIGIKLKNALVYERKLFLQFDTSTAIDSFISYATDKTLQVLTTLPIRIHDARTTVIGNSISSASITGYLPTYNGTTPKITVSGVETGVYESSTETNNFTYSRTTAIAKSSFALPYLNIGEDGGYVLVAGGDGNKNFITEADASISVGSSASIISLTGTYTKEWQNSDVYVLDKAATKKYVNLKVKIPQGTSLSLTLNGSNETITNNSESDFVEYNDLLWVTSDSSDVPVTIGLSKLYDSSSKKTISITKHKITHKPVVGEEVVVDDKTTARFTNKVTAREEDSADERSTFTIEVSGERVYDSSDVITISTNLMSGITTPKTVNWDPTASLTVHSDIDTSIIVGTIGTIQGGNDGEIEIEYGDTNIMPEVYEMLSSKAKVIYNAGERKQNSFDTIYINYSTGSTAVLSDFVFYVKFNEWYYDNLTASLKVSSIQTIIDGEGAQKTYNNIKIGSSSNTQSIQMSNSTAQRKVNFELSVAGWTALNAKITVNGTTVTPTVTTSGSTATIKFSVSTSTLTSGDGTGRTINVSLINTKASIGATTFLFAYYKASSGIIAYPASVANSYKKLNIELSLKSDSSSDSTRIIPMDSAGKIDNTTLSNITSITLPYDGNEIKDAAKYMGFKATRTGGIPFIKFAEIILGATGISYTPNKLFVCTNSGITLSDDGTTYNEADSALTWVNLKEYMADHNNTWNSDTVYVIGIPYGSGYPISDIKIGDEAADRDYFSGPLIGYVPALNSESMQDFAIPYFDPEEYDNDDAAVVDLFGDTGDGNLSMVDDGGDNHAAYQTANQYIYFRMDNPFNGALINRTSAKSSTGATAKSHGFNLWEQNAIYELLSGNSYTLGHIGSEGNISSGQLEMSDIDDFFNKYYDSDNDRAMMFVGPYLNIVNGIHLDSDNVNSYLTLGPGESVEIPLVMLYKTQAASPTVSYTIGFEVRNSLYNDPLYYQMTFNARYDQNAGDLIGSTSYKLSNTRYNVTNI